MEWNSPQVNKKGVMKAYVDEYDNHANGILQEDSQNGFDAYAKGTRIKDMKIEFKYDADQKILYYRDFKTAGMPHCSECEWGIRPDKTPCINDECSWGCYHNLAYSGKTGFSLGSRGMGKSLRIESGERTIVNTTLTYYNVSSVLSSVDTSYNNFYADIGNNDTWRSYVPGRAVNSFTDFTYNGSASIYYIYSNASDRIEIN